MASESHSAFVTGLANDAIRAEFDEREVTGFKKPRLTCNWCQKTAAENIYRQRRHLIGCAPYRRRKVAMQQRSIATLVTIRPQPKGYQEKASKMAATAIFSMGLPFTLLESPAMKEFIHELNPAFRSPTGDAIAGWLPTVWSERRDEVLAYVKQAPLINLIVDGSDDTSGNRVINVSFQIPNAAAFYWDTIDTGTAAHSADGYVSLIEPLIHDLVGDETSKINGIVTDTNSTMRKFHREMAKRPAFSHIFYTLCDSHGFQLLIKDILKIEPWKSLMLAVAKIVAFFKKSKLQLAILRQWQLRIYQQNKALITSVITRWGTQLRALTSVFDNKDALLAWARDENTPLSRDSQERSTQNEVIASLKNHQFWRGVEVLSTILKPVGEVQDQSESDRLNVGHTIFNWRKIEANWRQLQRSGEWSEVNWQLLLTTLATREGKQTLEIHLVAWALDPATRHLNLTINQLTRIEAFLRRYCTATAWPAVQRQFSEFRKQDGAHFGIASSTYNQIIKPYDFWLRQSVTDLELAPLARRIFSTLANSVPSERSFSATRFIQSKVRNRLTPERTNFAAFLFLNTKVLARLKELPVSGAEKSRPERWEEVSAVILMEMEDDYQSVFEPVSEDGLEAFLASLGDDSDDEMEALLS